MRGRETEYFDVDTYLCSIVTMRRGKWKWGKTALDLLYKKFVLCSYVSEVQVQSTKNKFHIFYNYFCLTYKNMMSYILFVF